MAVGVRVPSGTVTFLFTDIEGSTRLWDEHPEAMSSALACHDRILTDAVAAGSGYVFSSGGDGIAAAFSRSADAVTAAVAAQRALHAESWPPEAVLRVRMGLHTGETEERDGNYFGSPLNRAARLMAAAKGGQIVVSEVTAALIEHLDGVGLIDLGLHRLRGLVEPTRAFGVKADGLAWLDRPVTTDDAMVGNLPRALTDWFGPVAELHRRVGDLGRRRLVTLTGPGGVGKTRLAIEIGALVGDDFPDGIWMVDLAPVLDPDAVHAAVASTLGVLPQGGMTTLEAILEWIHKRRLLLILDNCEHVLPPVVSLTAAIIASNQAVTVLATSREPLGLSGERVVPVPPLEPHDGIELFCDRAAALGASVAFSDDDRATIGAICARLDGIPLAIELAAARSRSMGPEDLLARLDDRFRLLRSGGRGGLERHQTLRATVSWSYRLLHEAEQALFDRLSVFAGEFDLAAVEAVCAAEPIDELEIVDLLGALVDKSLVVATRAAGSTRYRLLETLRQYGEERLEERGETVVTRDRHLAHYVAVAVHAYQLWMSERYWQGAAVFDREWDNFRAAHTTALMTGDFGRAEAILGATYGPSLHEQRFEYLEWADRTLGAARAAGRHTAATYGQAASFLFRLGQHDEAIDLATSGLDTSPPEPDGTLLCLTYLLAALGGEQRRAEARAAAERVDVLLWADADPFLTAVAAAAIISGSSWNGVDSAARHLDRLEDMARTTGAPQIQEFAALSRGLLLQHRTPPDLPGALAAFQRGVEVARRTGSATMAGSNLQGVAICSVRLSLDTAADACREAIAHCSQARHWNLVWVSAIAATAQLLATGNLEPATVIYGYLEAHQPLVAASGSDIFGRQLGLSRVSGAEDIERLPATPDPDRWRAQGAAMDRHQVVRYALEHLGPSSAP
jgi:predicted ATPase/class 3 adenylate cyclase